MLRVAILGCCCTGDIFRLSPPDFSVELYHAGTSILSQMSPPLPLAPDAVLLENRFERRMVLNDFGKTFLSDLARTHPDYLLIDLVYEGRNPVRSGQSYVTRTGVMESSRVEETSGYVFEELDRTSEEVWKLWRKACRDFIGSLQKIIRAEQVVLHRALWLEKYRDGEKIFDFSPVYLAEGRHKNTIRNICYDFFAAHWPGIHILDLSQEGFLCDAGHTWGLRPSHFEPSYYWRAANLLRRIAGIAEQPG